MIKAYNIRWDTDGDKKLLEALPTEVLINDEDLQHYIDPDSDCDAKMDAVSDYLTDTYGYCHKGFDTCILPSEEELNLLDIIESALACKDMTLWMPTAIPILFVLQKDDLDFEIPGSDHCKLKKQMIWAEREHKSNI